MRSAIEPRRTLNTTRYIAAATLMILLTWALLTACGRPARSDTNKEEYVGVWILYKSQLADGSWREYDPDEDLVLYFVIKEDGAASMISTLGGNNPKESECRWYMSKNRGVVVVSDESDYSLTSIHSEETPRTVDARLVDFDLVMIPFNHYFEKISNSPTDTPWLSSDESGHTIASSETSFSHDAIDWTEAPLHVGEWVTVYGVVKDSSFLSSSNGQPSYIDIGAAYPDKTRVTMVVWGEDRDNFPGNPESIYLGKTVCVSGLLYEYDGTVFVKVETPDQIQVLE